MRSPWLPRLVPWVALLLAGCASTEHLPQSPTIAGDALGLSASPAPPIDAQWWRELGDPQLDALVERAAHDSPTLAQALARVARAQAEARLASSARGVQIDGSADVLRAYYNSGDIPLPAKFASGSAWGGVANVGVSWNLDFWGRQRELLRSAEGFSRAGVLDARAARLALEAGVVTSYLELDRDHALVELAQSVERNRTELAELTRQRVTAGLDTTVDLRNAAARVPEVRVDRAQAESRIEMDRHALAALTGEGAAAYEQLSRPHLTNEAALRLPTVLPSDLLLRRPDVAAALARVEAQGANDEAARLAAYPDIDLRGIGGFAALSVSDLLTHPARAIAVGPALRLPIFDAGRLRALHRVANADFEYAVAQYNATVLRAVREVSDQLTTLAALQSVLQDQEGNLELLQQALRLAQERYQAGLSTRQLVLEAEGRILAVESALVSSRATAAEERVNLLVAVGGSTEPVITTKAP